MLVSDGSHKTAVNIRTGKEEEGKGKKTGKIPFLLINLTHPLSVPLTLLYFPFLTMFIPADIRCKYTASLFNLFIIYDCLSPC